MNYCKNNPEQPCISGKSDHCKVFGCFHDIKDRQLQVEALRNMGFSYKEIVVLGYTKQEIEKQIELEKELLKQLREKKGTKGKGLVLGSYKFKSNQHK